MKTNRRDFLKSIAATAMAAATGFTMSAVRVEEEEPTELTEFCMRRSQYFAEGMAEFRRQADALWEERRRASALEDRDVRAGIDAMESFVGGFDCDIELYIERGHCQEEQPLVGTVESVNVRIEEQEPTLHPYYRREDPLETVDRTEYQEFEVIHMGADEFGPYWSARVKSKTGQRFVVGNYYDLEELTEPDWLHPYDAS